MLYIDLCPTHPYVLNFNSEVSISMLITGIFVVKWRSFDGIKQDADFTSREVAEAFKMELCRDSRRVYEDDFDSFAEYNAHWIQVYS